ncbi:MAG: hypothetical protein ABI602_01775 [Candidatus Saccharibacteria bacterium]
MESADSQIAKVNQARMTYATSQREVARTKLELSVALGQIVGSHVVVEGCPTTARFNQKPDPKSGQPRSVSLNVYSLTTPYSERQPVNCEGLVVWADNNAIEIAIDPPVTDVGRRTSYLFNVTELVSLSPLEIAPN